MRERKTTAILVNNNDNQIKYNKATEVRKKDMLKTNQSVQGVLIGKLHYQVLQIKLL